MIREFVRNRKRRREMRLFASSNPPVGTWWTPSGHPKPITQTELDRAFRDAKGQK